MARRKFTILVAGRRKLFHRTLKAVVARSETCEIVAATENGDDLVRLTERYCPNVVTIDVDSDAAEFARATEIISRENKQISVFAMLDHRDAETVTQMLNAGVSAVLSKDALYENILWLLELASSLFAFSFPGDQSMAAHRSMMAPQTDDLGASALSRREKEIVGILAEGKTSKEIAESLYISVRTVENHRKRIMQKLDIHNVADLTRFAIRHGLARL